MFKRTKLSWTLFWELTKSLTLFSFRNLLGHSFAPYWVFLIKMKNKVVGTLNHLTFFRPSSEDNDHLRVILYINMWLSHMQFSLRKDIFNHRDICCFFFFNNSDIFFMINIYSDNYQLALKYLKNTKANICNVLVIIGDFNIRNSI